MESSDQATLPPGGSDEHQLATSHSLSPSTAPGPSPRNQVDPAIEQLSAPQIEVGRDHHTPAPEQDQRLSEHRALGSPEQESSKPSSGALGKAYKAHAEPSSPPHNTRQSPFIEHSFASRSSPEKGFLSDTTSKSPETMGSVLSKLERLEKRVSRASRDQAESPETIVDASVPSPPRVQSRQSTMSGLGKGSPGSRSPHFRKDEERVTSTGEHTPSRRSGLPRIQEVNEGSTLDPETPNKSKSGFPTLSLTAPTPGLSTVYEESEQSVDPNVSNRNLPRQSSSRPSTIQRPSSNMSQLPSTARDPFSRPRPHIPMEAPALNTVQLNCYQGHQTIKPQSNVYCTLPCFVCKASISTVEYFKCIWCCLWLCPSCYNRLVHIKDRDLTELVAKVAKGKENRRSAGSGNTQRGKAKAGAEGSGGLAATNVNTKETEDKKKESEDKNKEPEHKKKETEHKK